MEKKKHPDYKQIFGPMLLSSRKFGPVLARLGRVLDKTFNSFITQQNG
jgi:hypothetical protein